MEVDDIIIYHDVVTAEKALLQKGMNYGVRKNYSVFLLPLRNAPYPDALDPMGLSCCLIVQNTGSLGPFIHHPAQVFGARDTSMPCGRRRGFPPKVS